jgi:hypothetical protein
VFQLPKTTKERHYYITKLTMASLPPTLNFSDAEEEICKKWKEEDTFRLQNKLSKERGDAVSTYLTVEYSMQFDWQVTVRLTRSFAFFATLLPMIFSHRNTPFTMALHLPLACRIMDTSWPAPSRTR